MRAADAEPRQRGAWLGAHKATTASWLLALGAPAAAAALVALRSHISDSALALVMVFVVVLVVTPGRPVALTNRYLWAVGHITRRDAKRGSSARDRTRWQAAYRGPDNRERTRTFQQRVDAERCVEMIARVSAVKPGEVDDDCERRDD